jgi:hypothetical protein
MNLVRVLDIKSMHKNQLFLYTKTELNKNLENNSIGDGIEKSKFNQGDEGSVH